MFILIVLFGLCSALALENPMENPALFEGDIILTEEQRSNIENDKMNPNIPLAAIKTNLWPLPIPWDIDASLLSEPKAVKVIKEAIAEYEKHTCLKFKRRTTELSGYIWFHKGQGCASPIGYSSSGRRGISLSSGCWIIGKVMHEIAHSLGFYHEQSRPDRDHYVKIYWNNIQGGLKDNFKKYGSNRVDSMNVPYDYLSMMHYPKTAFSIARRITIETLDPEMMDVIGQRKGFSQLDILQVNLLYNCPGVTRPPPGTLPSRRPVTTAELIKTARPSPTDCVDKATNCKFYKDNNYCKLKNWRSFMKSYCERSCDLCGTTISKIIVKDGPLQAIAPTSSTDCVDKVTNCKFYKDNNYCRLKRWRSFMERYCKKSCDLCGTSISTKLPVTTVGPTMELGRCGISSVQSGRVISGVDAKPGAWPWQILMLYRGGTTCGGSLVAPTWVVTAAHCLYGREHNVNSFKIRVGEHDSRSKNVNEDDIAVEKIIIHPLYKTRVKLDYDVAIIKLSRPAILGKYVNTVCIPRQGEHVPVGTQCYITGWGKIRHPGKMHHTLQQAKIPVVSKQACSNLNTKNLRMKITSRMVCAGHGGSTQVGGCHGDSGGPFVCQTGQNGRWELHGAVSWGSGRCDAKSAYTVFARISELSSWIIKNMNNN